MGSQYYEELKTLSNLADYQEYAVSILMNEKKQEVITLNAGSGVSSENGEISYVLEQLKTGGHAVRRFMKKSCLREFVFT